MSRHTRESLKQNMRDLDKISERLATTMHNKNTMIETEIKDVKQHTSNSNSKSDSKPKSNSKSNSILSSEIGKNNFSFY